MLVQPNNTIIQLTVLTHQLHDTVTPVIGRQMRQDFRLNLSSLRMLVQDNNVDSMPF